METKKLFFVESGITAVYVGPPTSLEVILACKQAKEHLEEVAEGDPQPLVEMRVFADRSDEKFAGVLSALSFREEPTPPESPRLFIKRFLPVKAANQEPDLFEAPMTAGKILANDPRILRATR